MRKLALALIAVFLVGVGTFAPATVSRASAATGPKVAIIVGATHSATSTYRSYADQIYAEAIAYTSNVVRVYSPNATWSNVKAAVNGASIVVYLGHGNGWPSPYTYDPLFTTKDGFGLNVDGDRSDYVNKYYGEPSIRTLTPAPNAVVLLFHLCYASGNSEPGNAEPTLSVAQQRVDNYASAFLKAGAGAVIADGHSHSGYITRLFTTRQTIDQLWRGMPYANGHVASYPSVRTPGKTYQLDPENSTSRYYRALTGSMTLTTADVTGAGFASTDTDPTDFQAPGAASVAVDDAPVYATEADAAAAHAAAGSAGDTAAEPSSPTPITTLPMNDKLRVSDITSTTDGADLLDVETLDGSSSGWMIGDTATPRDSQSPRVWSVSDGNALFTPNGDGDRDTYQLTVEISETASWTLSIEDGKGSSLATRSGTGDTAAITWDGIVGGSLAPDGTYRWRLTADDAWANPTLASTATFVLNHDPIVVTRLFGQTLYDTSAAISAASFGSNVPVAYIATGTQFPDALTGAPVAGKDGAPLLLTDPKALPPAIAAELTRLKPAKIVILGGPGAVSDAVLSALRHYAGTVTRLFGQTLYDTSAAISAASFGSNVPVAYIATGTQFPDALTGAPVAGKDGAPLLLTDPKALPPAIAAELTRLKPAKIVILGGPGAVSDAVLSALRHYAGTVTRLFGQTLYDTSAAISAASFGSNVPVAYIATGTQFPDALTGAPVAGKDGAPLLLTDPKALPPAIAAELTRLKPAKIVILGGPGAVSDAVLSALAAY